MDPVHIEANITLSLWAAGVTLNTPLSFIYYI